MHTVFFGGIAQYYDSAGVLVQDNEVPFVKTVARVSRAADGSMAEYKLPLEMPGYLGASAEFILDERMPVYANGVIKLDEMVGDSIHVGYIYGGINSSAKNIFWINNGTQSTAHAQIFKVYIVRNGATGLDDLNPQSRSAIRMQLSPNPNHGILHIMMEMAYTSDVQLTISSMNGAIIIDKKIPESSFKLGKNYLELNLAEARFGNVLFVTLRMTKDTITQKLIIHEE